MFAERRLCVEGLDRHAASFTQEFQVWNSKMDSLEEFSWMICDDFLFSNFGIVECCCHSQRVYSLKAEL